MTSARLQHQALEKALHERSAFPISGLGAGVVSIVAVPVSPASGTSLQYQSLEQALQPVDHLSLQYQPLEKA
jgi:hypothetical protein